MNKKWFISLAVCLLLASAIISGSGCTPAEDVGPNIDDIRAIADPIAADVLTAINEDDYAKYVDNAAEVIIQAVSEEAFLTANSQIRDIIGQYVSHEFWKVEEEQGFTLVYYKAVFTEEPDEVILNLVFGDIESEPLFSGIWLNSPKLRGETE